MIPEYLTLREAAIWLSEENKSSVPFAWLFQHACADKLQLFALLRRGYMLDNADRFIPSDMYEQGHRLPLDVGWAKEMQAHDFDDGPMYIHVYKTEKGIGHFANIVGGERSPLEVELRDLYVRSVDLEKFAHGADKKQGESLSAGEKSTLLKLILGMAMVKYKYNPGQSKSPAPKAIETDLELFDIHITDETVRKWLSIAAEDVSYKPRR